MDEYVKHVSQKKEQYGSFAAVCGLPEQNVTTAASTGAVTFFTDLTLPFMRIVKP